MIKNYKERMAEILEFLFGPNDPIIDQKEVVESLKGQREKISEPGLSKFKSEFLEGKKIGPARLKRWSDMLEKYINEDLGYEYNEDSGQFEKMHEKSGHPDRPLRSKIPPPPEKKTSDAVIHNGRLRIHEKAALIAAAQEEIIEVGVRLKTFVDYFPSRSDDEYSDHFLAAIKRGVVFKCYMLDPDSDIARIYFEERAKFDEEESESISVIRKAIRQLLKLSKEFEEAEYEGRLEVYTYNSIPCNHFFCVDGGTEQSKMIISLYMHATHRAKSPVIEFSREKHRYCYDLYWKSLQAIMENGKKVSE